MNYQSPKATAKDHLQIELESSDDSQNIKNPRFSNYSMHFNNLIKRKEVTTMYPIQSILISYDSLKVITVTKKDDTESWVK